MYTVYMLSQRVISATQARAKFFDLLKNAEEGKDVVIVKRDNNRRFKLVAVEEKPVKNVNKILREMGEIGFPFMSPQEIKKIILTKYDKSLSGY